MLLFLSDMDDVLYDYDYAIRMDRLAQVSGVERAELRRRWWKAGHEHIAEAGAATRPRPTTSRRSRRRSGPR